MRVIDIALVWVRKTNPSQEVGMPALLLLNPSFLLDIFDITVGFHAETCSHLSSVC